MEHWKRIGQIGRVVGTSLIRHCPRVLGLAFRGEGASGCRVLMKWTAGVTPCAVGVFGGLLDVVKAWEDREMPMERSPHGPL